MNSIKWNCHNIEDVFALFGGATKFKPNKYGYMDTPDYIMTKSDCDEDKFLLFMKNAPGSEFDKMVVEPKLIELDEVTREVKLTKLEE